METPVPAKLDMKCDLLTGVAFLLMYLWVYGSISLRTGLLWDEMLDVEGTATGMYLAAGRWGLALYRYVFGVGAFPVVAGLAAGVYIAVSLVWQTHLLNLHTWLQRLFYGGIYLSSVQWAYQLEFSHQSDAVAFGLLCSTAAVWLLQRRRWMCAVPVMVLALGMYQTVALHTLCLLLAVCLAGDMRLRLGAFAKGGGCLLLSLILCMGVARCTFLLPWVDAEEIAFQQGYQASLSRWSELPADATWGESLDFAWYYGSRFFKRTCKNMLGGAYDGQWVYATALLPLVLLVAGCLRKGCGRRSWLSAAGCLLLWALPFCPILLLFTDQGARVNMAEPGALAAIWGLYLGRSGTCLSRRAAVLLSALLGLALLKSAYRVGDIALNEARIFDQEVNCVRALHTRGMCAAEAAGLQSPDIILLGDYPAHREVTWGRRECFEERNAMDTPEKLYFYTRYLQIDNLRRGSESDMQAHGDAYRSMSKWPAAGSVRVDGNAVIIRVD